MSVTVKNVLALALKTVYNKPLQLDVQNLVQKSKHKIMLAIKGRIPPKFMRSSSILPTPFINEEYVFKY